MSNDNSVQNEGIASDEQIRNVLRRHIQRASDRREFNRAQLETESNVNVYTIDAIVSRAPAKHRRITASDALNIAYALGEEAVAALVGTICYTATRGEADALAPSQIIANALPHMATIATAAADNRFDHTERLGGKVADIRGAA